MSLTILGVDPGSRITGFGVLRVADGPRVGQVEHINHGVILMDTDHDFATRMVELGQGFREVMAKYKPQHVVIEKIFLGRNADSAFKLGHARGVVMYEAGNFGARVMEYATRMVKKSVTGTGSASKEEVQLILQRLLRLQTISRLDASDALAVAYHHAMFLGQKKIIDRAMET